MNKDDIFKRNIGKRIGIFLGELSNEDENGNTIDVLNFGVIISVHGRWLAVRNDLEEDIRYFNLDRIDYFIFEPNEIEKILEVKHNVGILDAI